MEGLKVKALPLSIYKNPMYAGCANGGWSDSHDELWVACPEGFMDVSVTDPGLFVLRRGPRGVLRLEPNVEQPGKVGPMAGGSYAGTSDGRFVRMCEKLSGSPWYGAVAVHDRFESAEQYRVMSR